MTLDFNFKSLTVAILTLLVILMGLKQTIGTLVFLAGYYISGTGFHVVDPIWHHKWLAVNTASILVVMASFYLWNRIDRIHFIHIPLVFLLLLFLWTQFGLLLEYIAVNYLQFPSDVADGFDWLQRQLDWTDLFFTVIVGLLALGWTIKFLWRHRG